MKQISTEKEELYMCQTPKGRHIPILVRLGEVEERFPNETEITAAVRGQRGRKAGETAGMQAEDLNVWIREAT